MADPWDYRKLIDDKIAELRADMISMNTDFEGMQALQAQIEVLKELINDTSEDNIESNWFDLYGMVLERRITGRE